MCDRTQAIAIMGEAYAACRDIFGDKLRDAYLYGSYARGDYNEYSDVDILLTVDMDPEELTAYHKKVGAINCRLTDKYDILVSASVDPFTQFQRYAKILPFYKNVLTEGIPYGQ